MQKHLLTDGTKEIWLEYPEDWDELNCWQMIFAGRALWMLTNKQIDVDQFRKMMVDRFIRRDYTGLEKFGTLDQKMDMWANEGLLMDTVNFFFKITKTDDGKEVYEIMPTLTRNVIPKIRVGVRHYYGPGDFLQGMTFSQFKDALTAAHKYMETQDDAWLTRLLAVCYLPKGEKYRMKTAVKREKRFSRVKIGIKYALFCYIMGCMQTLRTDAGGNGIEIDGTRCRFSLIFGNKGGGKGRGSAGIGLTGVLMTLAESGVFGDTEKTADTDVWDVLARLYQLELQRREMESKSPH